jgi:hypothetical protein
VTTSSKKGYAFASQNKGILNATLTTAADPLGCRLFPGSGTYVHFYANDPGKQFSSWAGYMLDAAVLARTGTKAAYGGPPRFTYAVGTSNGGLPGAPCIGARANSCSTAASTGKARMWDEHAPTTS